MFSSFQSRMLINCVNTGTRICFRINPSPLDSEFNFALQWVAISLRDRSDLWDVFRNEYRRAMAMYLMCRTDI